MSPKPRTDEAGADKRSVVINMCAKHWSHNNFGLCLPVPRGRPTEITKFKLSMKRAKKEFKNNGDEIFVTQDLTRQRQSIVSEISQSTKCMSTSTSEQLTALYIIR